MFARHEARTASHSSAPSKSPNSVTWSRIACVMRSASASRSSRKRAAIVSTSPVPVRTTMPL